MTDTPMYGPAAVLRSEMQEVINAALNHVFSSKLAGLYSSTGRDLERAVLNMPCLYCSERNMDHSEHCDREWWNGKQPWEDIVEGLIREEMTNETIST